MPSRLRPRMYALIDIPDRRASARIISSSAVSNVTV